MPVCGTEVLHPKHLTYPHPVHPGAGSRHILTSFDSANFAVPRSEAGVGFPSKDPYQWKPKQFPMRQISRQLLLQCFASYLKSVYSTQKQNDLSIQGLCI